MNAVKRAFALMEVMGEGRPELTVAKIDERLPDISRTAVGRLILTLGELGYVEQHLRGWRLTPRVLSLSNAYIRSLGLSQVAQRHLDRLVERTNQYSSLSILVGDQVVYVAGATPSQGSVQLRIPVGTRRPAVSTASGLVLLSALSVEDLRTRLGGRTPRELNRQLKQVRDSGFASVDLPDAEGVRVFAAPVLDASRMVVASVEVAALTGRSGAQTMRRNLLPYLLHASEALGADLVPR